MLSDETPVIFYCNNNALLGITHPAEKNSKRGVIIVVGGPQYRVGSHRQFLVLARGLAACNIPVFRFDYRGMGDSEGLARGYDLIDDDIRAAIDTFFKHFPSLEEVVLWGLCDGASAASFYGYQDNRVSGLVLVNPWIRTEQGKARAIIKHYYLGRIISRGFWNKVFSGNFDVKSSFQSFIHFIKRLSMPAGNHDTQIPEQNDEKKSVVNKYVTLPDRFYGTIKKFQGSILLITSGKDLTAVEFLDTVKNDKNWKKILVSPSFKHIDLPDADHTFSRKVWMEEVIEKSRVFVKSL